MDEFRDSVEQWMPMIVAAVSGRNADGTLDSAWTFRHLKDGVRVWRKTAPGQSV